MSVSSVTVRSLAAEYSLPELQEALRGLLEKLKDPDMITSASPGGGTSYTRAQRVKLEDLIATYQLAIDYKQNGGHFSQEQIAQFITPIATH